MMTNQRLDTIKAQLAAGAPEGKTWKLEYEPCGCGEFCAHESYPHSIFGPVNVHMLDRDDETRETYGRTITEICEFTEEAALLAASAPAIIRELLDEVERQRSRAAGMERAAAARTYNFGVRYADQSANEVAPKMKTALDAVMATAGDLEAQAKDLYTKADAMTDPMFMHRARSRADAYTRIAGDIRRNITDALS